MVKLFFLNVLQAVLKVLKDCQVENVVQEITENPKLMRVNLDSF